MPDSSPTLSLWLDGRQSIQLGRKGFAGSPPVIKVHMHDTSHGATLVLPGYQSSTRTFNLRHALQSGVFSLFDAESHAKIPVSREEVSPDELPVKAGAPLKLLDMKLDAEDTFWSQLLRPGHKYDLGWTHDSDNAPWVYREEKPEDPSSRLPVRLDTKLITYTVLDSATETLPFSLSITPTDSICNMSGTPPFGLKLSITSHHTSPLTVCLASTPLKELHGLEEIVTVEDEAGQQVEWDYGIGCWEDDGPTKFPADALFEEFEPGKPYERVFWLSKAEGDEGYYGGDLGDLEKGKKYRGEVSRMLLRSLGRNRVGRKEEVLAGSEKEKEERWRGLGKMVFLEVSEPFTFETV